MFNLVVLSALLTTEVLSVPSVFFSFPGQIGNEWSHEGGKRFEATCKFAILTLQSPDTEDFVIQFGSQVSQFEAWVVNVVSNTGEVIHLQNKYWMNPEYSDNLEVYFQVTYYGSTRPTVTCKSNLPEYVTAPALPYTFPATLNVTWLDSEGLYVIEAYCVFAIDATTAPNTKNFVIDFKETVKTFSQWNGVPVQPQGTSGYKFHMTNLYGISPPYQVFVFQATYLRTLTPPLPVCSSDFAEYSGSLTTTAPASTQTPPASTQTPQPTTQIPPTQFPFNYYEVLQKSIWFYRAQRSGDLPVVPNDPVPWRGDSALYDGSDVGVDLTGGWYDAGDWVKFNFPISSATAVLAWGLVQWKNAYVNAGLHAEMLDCIKWSLDFLLKCWKPDQQVLYGQVGNGDTDHSKMMRPEEMTPSNMPRPAYSMDSSGGGSDLAGTMVAAFAAGAMAFQSSDPTYATTLLSAAQTLYQFADTNRAIYTAQIHDAANYYQSSSYNDELVYAAAMLYKATGDNVYLQDALNKYNQFGFNNQVSWAFDWSDKLMAAKLLLYEATNNTMFSSDITTYLNDWRPSGSVQYTPGGLAWRLQWGANRYAANSAFIALMAADLGINPVDNIAWVKTQIHYMLGDNPRQSSYVVGFGNNPPLNPHHKSSVCDYPPAACDWAVFNSAADNAHTLYGALVGGPDANDNYVDERTDYVKAEVTCDYNAGFQSAVAGLILLG